MSSRPAIDVSHLPEHDFDTVDAVWWGDNWLLAIETTMFAISIATYFYLRQNFDQWPPPLAQLTAPLNPNPDLGYGTANTLLLLISCLPMIFVDRAARRGEQTVVQVGLIACVLCGIASMVLRGLEFSAVKFRWDSNAYGSIVWFILGMHLLHLLTVTCETVLLLLWSLFREFDMKHRVDTTVLAVYWYWVAGIWVLLYGIIYFTPRLW